MFLIDHIVFSCLGIVGAYVHGIPYLRRYIRGDVASPLPRLMRAGLSLERIGLAGVAITGVILLFIDTDQLTRSGRLLSNITLAGVLIVASIVFYAARREKTRGRARIASLATWAWIFIVAVTGTAFPYGAYIGAYAVMIGAMLYFFRSA